MTCVYNKKTRSPVDAGTAERFDVTNLVYLASSIQ